MRKNRIAVLFAVVMAVALTLSACGNKKTALNEAMQNAWAASKDMRSFTFEGSFVIDELGLPEGSQGMILSELEAIGKAPVSFRGAYVQDPLHMEITLKLAFPGDAALTLEVPIILTDDNLYVRIPSIPFLPLGDAAGRFVKIDPAKLEEQAGALPALDVGTQRELSVDVLNILARNLDEEHYFWELKRNDVPGLPEDVKADLYVQLRIGEDNFDAFVQAMADHVVPEILDLLFEKEAYRSALHISEDGLREMKEKFGADGPDSPRSRLEALKESLTVHEVSMTGAIKDGHFVWQMLKGDVEIAENGETTAVAFTFSIRYDNINGDVTFEHGIPEDAMSLEEFGQMFFFGLPF